MASLSKAISNMLQYNIPPQEISRTLRGQQYEPSGFVSRHPYIKQATSISDLVSKIIDIELGDFSRCQVKPNGKEMVLSARDFIAVTSREFTADSNPVSEPPTADLSEEAKAVMEKGERVYGESCANCGSTRLRRNGTCKVCEECGATTGCS